MSHSRQEHLYTDKEVLKFSGYMSNVISIISVENIRYHTAINQYCY